MVEVSWAAKPGKRHRECSKAVEDSSKIGVDGMGDR